MSNDTLTPAPPPPRLPEGSFVRVRSSVLSFAGYSGNLGIVTRSPLETPNHATNPFGYPYTVRLLATGDRMMFYHFELETNTAEDTTT